MDIRFPGFRAQLRQASAAAGYRAALIPFKLIAVADPDSEFVRNITRFSNKQNAVRGRDFLTLEEDFRRLKAQLADRGYYLEVQTGEYDVLPKSQREKFPSDVRINAFDALRFYGAAILAKPHTAFGRSGEFTPGGSEFDNIMLDLTTDDLLVPWMTARYAEGLGYSVGAKWHAATDDHRNQTRYFYLYGFFRIANTILHDSSVIDRSRRGELYRLVLSLHQDHQRTPANDSLLSRLLNKADVFVSTYMALAAANKWYADRNAFLKSQELLAETNLLLATAAVLLDKQQMKAEIQAQLASQP
jgi:hypothetical protein